MATISKPHPSIANAIKSFTEQCPHDYVAFPLGGNITLPLDHELALLKAIDEAQPILPSDVANLRKQLHLRAFYAIVIFSVRMAVFAARINDSRSLVLGLVGLVVDEATVDWRDLLCALSIVEDCASRVGVDFHGEMKKLYALASPEHLDTIVDGYFSRPIQGRDVGTMGFAALGSGETLTFEHIR